MRSLIRFTCSFHYSKVGVITCRDFRCVLLEIGGLVLDKDFLSGKRAPAHWADRRLLRLPLMPQLRRVFYQGLECLFGSIQLHLCNWLLLRDRRAESGCRMMFASSGTRASTSLFRCCRSRRSANSTLMKRRPRVRRWGFLSSTSRFLTEQVPPSRLGFLTFAQFVHKRASEGLRVAVHCRACIGRSSVLLATVMRLEGFTAKEAFGRISEARGLRVPDTAEQARWVSRLAI